ncbi:hypothetical protein Pelo_8207 [Pelomyxa schiedti]|nr:hypothetical protein Pelo_8207 [Pelomyxa schiedti]
MSASAVVATTSTSSSGEGRGATRAAAAAPGSATAVAAGTGTGTQGNHLGEQGEGVGEREARPCCREPVRGEGRAEAAAGGRGGICGDLGELPEGVPGLVLPALSPKNYVARDLLACFKPRNAQVTVDEEQMASILDGMGTKLRAINFRVESDTGRSGLLLFKAIRRSSVDQGREIGHIFGPDETDTRTDRECIQELHKANGPSVDLHYQSYGRGTDDWSGSPCFLGDGTVTCALTGVSLSVSDVRPGMKLRGPPRNTLSEKTTISQIRRIERTPVEKVMQIAFVNSLGRTPEHGIMIPKKGNNDKKEEPDWVKAGDVGELSSVFVKELFNFELEKDEENQSSSVLINDLQVSTVTTPFTRKH